MGKSKEIKSSKLAKKIMIYKNLILNHKVFNNISSFHNTNHLPNAFIFHGENGVGKEAHAIEFFALLNCNNPNNNQSCGICNSCSKTKKLQHENLEIIFPYPKYKPLKKEDHPNASVDKHGRLIVAGAVGIEKSTLDRVTALVEKQVDAIVVDTAHGHSKSVLDITKTIVPPPDTF